MSGWTQRDFLRLLVSFLNCTCIVSIISFEERGKHDTKIMINSSLYFFYRVSSLYAHTSQLKSFFMGARPTVNHGIHPCCQVPQSRPASQDPTSPVIRPWGSGDRHPTGHPSCRCTLPRWWEQQQQHMSREPSRSGRAPESL